MGAATLTDATAVVGSVGKWLSLYANNNYPFGGLVSE
jgi:hypothetical protein